MLLLPIATIAIIGIVSLLLVAVIVVAIVRSKCCRKRNDENAAKHDGELDRFLDPEESEDEKSSTTCKPKISNEDPMKISNEHGTSSYEGTFHFVDVHVQENQHVDNKSEPIKSNDVISRLDEVVIVENVSNDNVVVEKLVIHTVEETPAVSEDISTTLGGNRSTTPSPVDSRPIGSPPYELTSIESPPIELPSTGKPLSVPTGSDDRDVYSDDSSIVSDLSNVSGTKNKMDGLRKQPEKSRTSTQQQQSTASSENAKLKICLQYIESVKCLKGRIVSIEGLKFQGGHSPREINFHLRFFPNKRFHIATKYKPISEDTSLNLTFTMGPVYTEDLTNNSLRVKLYGKKAQLLTRSRCYGECTYILDKIIGKHEPIEYVENIIQRVGGSTVYSSDSDGVL